MAISTKNKHRILSKPRIYIVVGLATIAEIITVIFGWLGDKYSTTWINQCLPDPYTRYTLVFGILGVLCAIILFIVVIRERRFKLGVVMGIFLLLCVVVGIGAWLASSAGDSFFGCWVF
jgi:hypothetical protein